MKIIIPAFLLILLASCEHETPQPVKHIEIKNYTATDNNGLLMSAADPDDWTYDSSWSGDLTALFLYQGMTDFAKAPASDSNMIEVRPCYPNPSKNVCNISIKHSKAAKLKVVIVDEYLNTQLSSELSLGISGYSNISLDLTGLKKKKLYRLYYMFMNHKSEYYYRGHGDINLIE